MKMEHPLYPNRPLGSLLWRQNPFNKDWEYWNMNTGYWFVGKAPKPHFDDKIVSYRKTWAEPAWEIEDATE